ncbi:unnamed protein product, partial [Brachionus calyciflorus]
MELSIISNQKTSKFYTRSLSVSPYLISKYKKNKLEPVHGKLSSVDFFSLIQEKIDFTNFNVFSTNFDSSNYKIIKRKFKLSYFFCFCVTILTLIILSSLVLLIIFTNKNYYKNIPISKTTIFNLQSSATNHFVRLSTRQTFTSKRLSSLFVSKNSVATSTLNYLSSKTRYLNITSFYSTSHSTKNIQLKNLTISTTQSSKSSTTFSTKTINLTSFVNNILSTNSTLDGQIDKTRTTTRTSLSTTVLSNECKNGFTGIICSD